VSWHKCTPYEDWLRSEHSRLAARLDFVNAQLARIKLIQAVMRDEPGEWEFITD